ncbi:histidine phosphatase family protein [Sporosarcina thermotolerans]|uniref:Histidine phosphatase family protein n=1 Tax=Sporosarcina thermotolerans TaxID=633404 RepID=A0AAW9A9W5_9BACL|nr:histidine phosphatase family protein [Sporosarcina thermotolerans]MDW0116421.1 histidine phosphatase family protein [Sporosarcina thermotolerans]WHT48371.1 histidine phosphatase family protein [Sporosarcina thermotolerans]
MANNHHLYLIRHLQTAGNRERKYIGWTDEPIEKVSDVFWNLAIPEIVHGSDLLRAQETAALLFPNAVYHSDARFRECNFGNFEGKTYADLEMDKDYRNWLDDMERRAPRGGESMSDVERRVLEALTEMPNGAVIVTHGGPIRIAMTRFSKEVSDFWSWEVPHGSAWKFEWETYDKLKESGRCMSLSEVPITGKGTMSKS